jgi:hypothetical protein
VSPSNKPKDDASNATPEPDTRARKPYEKPRFAREQLFETMALACGKTNPTIGACKLVKKNS